MSQTPHEKNPHPGPDTAPSQQDQAADAEQQPEEAITLDELNAYIAEAEALHADLSSRLDSITRD